MSRFYWPIVLVMITTGVACSHHDSTPIKPDPRVEQIMGWVEGPDGNYYEELRINDRRCIVVQYANDQTPSLDCLPPETTTTTGLYRYP